MTADYDYDLPPNHKEEAMYHRWNTGRRMYALARRHHITSSVVARIEAYMQAGRRGATADVDMHAYQSELAADLAAAYNMTYQQAAAAVGGPWQPELHATYCPQHYPCPPDAGGSSWLCDCAGPLVELRTAVQALLDSQYGSNAWAEAHDVVQDIMAEQQRIESQAEADDLPNPWNPDDLRDPDASCEEADLPADERAQEVT